MHARMKNPRNGKDETFANASRGLSSPGRSIAKWSAAHDLACHDIQKNANRDLAWN